MLHHHFWIKVQMLQVTLGPSFPLSRHPGLSGEANGSHGDRGNLAEGIYYPQDLSSPGLPGCKELMGTSQSPEPRQPSRKVTGRSGRARQTEISGGQGTACGGRQERPSPGLKARAQPLQRLRSRWVPTPRRNLPSGKGSR